MYRDTGVKVEFLYPYSPNFNSIKEFFRVLKKFIKKKWHENEDFSPIAVQPVKAAKDVDGTRH